LIVRKYRKLPPKRCIEPGGKDELAGRTGGTQGLENKAKREGRLPPGQSLTLKWPVLHYGSVPLFDPAKWDFKISGLVEEPRRVLLAARSLRQRKQWT
jgi:DMSO/TMAO reductase YedYZ molybdopterin-dependent catalytic subunit